MVLTLYCCADTNPRLRERSHSGQQDSAYLRNGGLVPALNVPWGDRDEDTHL
jgi:hypothetical protein